MSRPKDNYLAESMLASSLPIRRDNNFDLLRLVAAILVIVGHSYSITGTPSLIGVLGMGVHTLGVKIFFALAAI